MPKPRPLRGFISARVSTPEQARDPNTSIGSQIETGLRMAAGDGVPVAPEDIYVDDETGQYVGRKNLSNALTHLEDYTHGYFPDPSRIGRNRETSTAIRAALAEAGVKLRLHIGDTNDLDLESKLWLESISDAASEAEILRFVRRSLEGRGRRARRGLPPTNVPGFYRVVRDTESGKSTGAELIEEYRPFLDQMAALFIKHCSYYEIESELKTNPFTGNRLTRETVKDWIHNPFLRGWVAFGKRSKGGRYSKQQETMLVKGTHQPAWDEQTCLAIQREIERRAKLHRKVPRGGQLLLSSILRCAKCGRTMSGSPTRSGNRKIRYACPRVEQWETKRTPHGPNSISEKAALQLIRELLSFFTVESIDAAVTELLALGSIGNAAFHEAAAQQAREQAEQLRADLKAARSPRARKLLEDDLAELEAEIAKAEQAARDEPSIPIIDAEPMRAALAQLVGQADWSAFPRDELRQLLKRAVPPVYLWRGQLADPEFGGV